MHISRQILLNSTNSSYTIFHFFFYYVHLFFLGIAPFYHLLFHFFFRQCIFYYYFLRHPFGIFFEAPFIRIVFLCTIFFLSFSIFSIWHKIQWTYICTILFPLLSFVCSELLWLSFSPQRWSHVSYKIIYYNFNLSCSWGSL